MSARAIIVQAQSFVRRPNRAPFPSFLRVPSPKKRSLISAEFHLGSVWTIRRLRQSPPAKHRERVGMCSRPERASPSTSWKTNQTRPIPNGAMSAYACTANSARMVESMAVLQSHETATLTRAKRPLLGLTNRRLLSSKSNYTDDRWSNRRQRARVTPGKMIKAF